MTYPLYIPPNIYDDLITLCVNAQPEEARGVLMGEEMQVMAVIALEHIAPDLPLTLDTLNHSLPTKITGLSVIGLFHSRPTAPPVLSPQEVQKFANLNTLHLVVSLKGSKPQISAWGVGETVAFIPIVFDFDQYTQSKFRLSSWTQKQNIAMILMTTLSIIALIILSIILLPPAP